MGPRYRAPRNPTRSQISSAKTAQTWHYTLRKPLTALNDINALRARGSVYCSSRVKGPRLGDLSKLARGIGHIYELDIAEQETALVGVLKNESRQKRVPMMAPEPPSDFV